MPEVKILKASLRIPTKQQYSYIEIQVEGSVEDIVDTYLHATDVYSNKAKEWENSRPPF